TAVNELVSGSLALKLGLPTLDIVFVNLPQDIIQLSDDLRQRNIQSGLHIGFKRLPEDVLDFTYLNDDMLLDKTLVNRDELYGVVNFDNWVLNTDRNNQGNNMIEFLPQNQIRYIMIDFGHCFTGNNWNQDLQNAINRQDLMGVFDFIRRQLISINEFEKWFVTIESMNDTEIDSIVDSIPSAWNLSQNEKSILLELIKNRKHLVRNIICNNRVTLNLDN
ncbi:MAG: HipA family kinase, partial [Nitrosopumilaceae archaeon]